MSAASYYNGDHSDSQPQIGPENTYSNGPHKIPTIQSQSQLYTGSAYNGPNEGPAHPVDPLLNKPTNHIPSTTHQGPQKLHMIDPSLNRIKQRKFQKLKRYLRIVQILTKTISIIFSTAMFGIMIFITAKYQTTKDVFRGGRTAWPKDPKPWPTFMLLAASGVTLVLSFVTLLAYCTNFSKARRSWKLTVVKYVIHIGAWIVVSIIYRYEKGLRGNNNDLWGWTCSEEVAALQSEFNGVVNFRLLCDSQVSSRRTPRL